MPSRKGSRKRSSKRSSRKKSASVKGSGAYYGKRNFVRGKGAYYGKRNFVRGKGDFFSDMGESLGRRAGQFIGGLAGQPLKMLGLGDYSASAATLAPPHVANFGTSERANVVTHREYLGDVYSSVNFASTVFNVNPGLGNPASDVDTMAGVFPWASSLAQNYEKYELAGCIFEFISTSSDAVVSGATTSSLGQVVMATEYNVNRPDFGSLTDALNSQFATSNKPSVNFCHPIECAKKDQSQNLHYVRTQPTPESSDILQFDFAKVNLITQGMPADGEIIGQLWISYKIRLYSPILQEGGSGADTVSVHYGKAGWVDSGVLATVSNSAPFGDHTTSLDTALGNAPEAGSTVELVFNSNLGHITLPNTITSGNWSLMLRYKGTSATLTNALIVSATTNCTDLKIVNNDARAYQNIPAGLASAEQFCICYFTVTAAGAVLSVNAGTFTLPTSLTAADCVMQPLGSLILTNPRHVRRSNFWRPRRGNPTAPWLSNRNVDTVTFEIKEDRSRYYSQSAGGSLRHLESKDCDEDEDIAAAMQIYTQMKAKARAEAAAQAAAKVPQTPTAPPGYVLVQAPTK